MSVNYRHCYEVLQLEPGASWEELRKHYKHLVQQCHPDRFQDDPDALREAEASLREFNAAYSILAEYHRINKRLPLAGGDSHADWQFQNTSELKDREEQLYSDGHRRSILNLKVSHWAVFALPVITVLLVVGFLASLSDNESEAEPASNEEVVMSDVLGHLPEKISPNAFGYGDSWKQVLDIQGEPTSRTESTWFYGKSRVSFEKGHVVGWKEHADAPLRVKGGTPETTGSGKRTIQLGDSKEVVREIQGEPMMKSGRRWEYGPSFIEFSDGRVVRWHSSVLRPLAVADPSARKD